jgi:hypothetical protein
MPLIRAINSSFQNSANRSEKNNQLDSPAGTQYFCNHSVAAHRGQGDDEFREELHAIELPVESIQVLEKGD